MQTDLYKLSYKHTSVCAALSSSYFIVYSDVFRKRLTFVFSHFLEKQASNKKNKTKQKTYEKYTHKKTNRYTTQNKKKIK